MSGYLRPVGDGRRISSFYAHINNRRPRSTEPGTDYYCPIGTPVVAPAAGVVGMTGDSIILPSGRFVFIKFDSGLSGRGLHLSRRTVNVGDRVKKGQVIGYSGASGYGTNDWSSNPDTGGAHIHWTFWPTHTMRFNYDANGNPYTLDPEVIFGGSTAGDGPLPFPEEDEMSAQAEAQIDALYKAVFGANNGTTAVKAPLKWVDISGVAKQTNYGLLDIVIANQGLIANAKIEATEAHTAIDKHVADWLHGNPAVNREPGRLYAFLRQAAEPAQIDVTALATALAAALPAHPAGDELTAAEVETAVRTALSSLTLTLEP